jgi:hypothetical protein
VQYIWAGQFDRVALVLSDIEEYLRSREQAQGLHSLQTMPQLLLERFIKPVATDSSVDQPTHTTTTAAADTATAASSATTPAAASGVEEKAAEDEQDFSFGLGAYVGMARAPFASSNTFASSSAIGSSSAASALFDEPTAKSKISSIFDDNEHDSLSTTNADDGSADDASRSSSAANVADTPVVASIEWDDTTFTAAQADSLIEMLSTVSLPGVSASAQLHLTAVIDTWKRAKEFRGGIDEVCGPGVSSIDYRLYNRCALVDAVWNPLPVVA